MSNYVTKTDLKKTTGIGTFNFELKSNLASLKTEVNKLDIDKLKPVRVDLSKLSDVAKNDVVKKTVYRKLVTKVNKIDTSGFVSKTECKTEKSDKKNIKTNILQIYTNNLIMCAYFCIEFIDFMFLCLQVKL